MAGGKRLWSSVMGALVAVSAGVPALSAQRATAVPQLDLNKITGTWYQVARLPQKNLKKCVSDGTVLYALNDKKSTFQRGIFCTVKGGDRNNINDSGNQDKEHDGKLRIRHWVLFHRPEWVLALDPQFRWALVGSPNHKELWILSRDPEMDPELYTHLQGMAASQGFPVGKLVPVTHPKDRITLASPSADPRKIVTTGTDPAAIPSATSPAATSSPANPTHVPQQ